MENEGIEIPKPIKDRLKEIALLASDTMQYASKTERTAFLFTLTMLLKDYTVFAVVSEAASIDQLNQYINDYPNAANTYVVDINDASR